MRNESTLLDRTSDLMGMPYAERFTAEFGSWKIAGTEISGWYVWDNADQRQKFGQLFQDRADAEEWVEIAEGSQRAQDLTFLANLK